MLKRRWLQIALGIFLVLAGLTGVAVFKFLQEPLEPIAEETQAESEEPPKSAAEILAAEFAGDPEAFPKATAEDLARAPVDHRESMSLDEEFESLPEPDRSPASVPKKLDSRIVVESAKTVLSKNLNRKKALAQLKKDFAKDDCRADLGKSKTLKATVELKKDGAIGKIQINPSAPGEKNLVKCLRKKLTAKAKAYKSKSKSGAKLTLHLKGK